MRAIYATLDWITKLAYLNILWMFFTVLGLIVFGLFPATAATFAVVRRWVIGETDIPVFKTFWKVYKKEFFKSNLLGYILLVIGLILYIDIRIFNTSSNSFVNLLAIPAVGMMIILILTSLYVFPTFVHYEIKLIQVFKNAFLIMAINPLPTITMLIGLTGVGFVFMKLQGFIPIFSGSIMTFVITMPAVRAFQKMESKKEVYTENN